LRPAIQQTSAAMMQNPARMVWSIPIASAQAIAQAI
jgi:hypothetical protein